MAFSRYEIKQTHSVSGRLQPSLFRGILVNTILYTTVLQWPIFGNALLVSYHRGGVAQVHLKIYCAMGSLMYIVHSTDSICAIVDLLHATMFDSVVLCSEAHPRGCA